MCRIDSFICEFKKYYYELDRKTQLIYMNIFMSKLPYPLSTSIREIWKSRPEELGDTLAGVIQILYEEIRNQCLEREKIKNLNLGSTSLCCNKLELDLPENYGCNKRSRKNHRRKETLALIQMLEKHRIYVLDKEFIVRTDSTYVAGFKNINHKGTYKQGRLI